MQYPNRSTEYKKDIRKSQLDDSELRTIIKALEDVTNEEINQKGINRGYFLHKGVLYRYTDEQEDDDAKLVVPASELQNILWRHHDSPFAGHYGIDKTVQRISKHYFWPRMRQDIVKHVSSCVECQRYKISNRKPAGLMQTSVTNQRFEVLAVDLFGPLPESRDGCRWILVVEDTASRRIELIVLSEATAENCAQTLLDECFLRYGLPRRIISDKCTQFISSVMQKLTFCIGIKQSFIPLYHAEANMVERKNRDLKTQLGIPVGNNHTTWPQQLSAIRFAMNTVQCDSTGHTAAYLTFGRELRGPQEITDDLSAIVKILNQVIKS